MFSIRTALMLAAVTIASFGCTAQTTDRMHTPDIFTAISNNDSTAVAQWLQSKPDLEVRNGKQETPLMTATYSNNVRLAKMLIAAGASVNAQDHMLNSPFLYAGASGYLEILRACLQAGASYKIYNRYGGTALIPACERGHVEIVKELLKDRTFPIDHINKLGWTGLLEAILLSDGGSRHVEIVQLLVNAGCNVNIADKDGITPLAHARKKGFTAIAAILEKAGAK